MVLVQTMLLCNNSISFLDFFRTPFFLSFFADKKQTIFLTHKNKQQSLLIFSFFKQSLIKNNKK